MPAPTKTLADRLQGFTEKARKIHGEKYDLSKAVYRSSSEKIEIVCQVHGPFLIRASNFLRGVGCAKCGHKKTAEKQRKTRHQFIKEAQQVHGCKYDYEYTVYVSNHQSITISCPAHGKYSQLPSNHLSGKGCPKCGVEKNARQLTITQDDFLKKATAVHGSKYDYSRAVYRSAVTPVEIVCPTHGVFNQTPNKHCDIGQGCPACANRDMDLKKFVLRAQKVHGSQYDYKSSVYTGARKKISIWCKSHGRFSQRADHHLKGVGCPACVDALNSRGSKKIELWLQENGIAFEREKSFKSLMSEKPALRQRALRFDFWLGELGVVIEFDGRQHHRPVAIWGGEEAFRRLVAHDIKKEKWANMNGIKMIRIRFDQEHSIAEILDQALRYAVKNRSN
jgi:hypothetical protein